MTGGEMSDGQDMEHQRQEKRHVVETFLAEHSLITFLLWAVAPSPSNHAEEG
jgi:hypothetical protein